MRIVGASLVLLAGCATPALHAAEVCHRPRPHTLIKWYNSAHPKQPLRYDARTSAIYHPISVLRTSHPPLYWIGLAWLDPQSGALFTVRCDGSIMDGAATGAIGKLSEGPRLPPLGQSVMLVYVSKETSTCVHDAVRIAALKDNKIITLWEHGYNQGINVPAALGKPRRFVSESFSLELSKDQQTLSISGTRAVYPYLKNGAQAPISSASATLPTETYHWNPKALRFLPAKPYPQPRPCRFSDVHNAK